MAGVWRPSRPDKEDCDVGGEILEQIKTLCEHFVVLAEQHTQGGQHLTVLLFSSRSLRMQTDDSACGEKGLLYNIYTSDGTYASRSFVQC